MISEAEKGPVAAQKSSRANVSFSQFIRNAIRVINALMVDSFYNRIAIPIIITAASIFTKVIIRLVPYTEIDFSTYMQQINLVNEGELDYSKIGGDTGPIVYPAGFVQIYQFLALVTKNGFDLRAGQNLFSTLFVATTALSVVVYTQSNSPSWPLYLLLFSKRLYSIYVLRLFNDCFTTFCMCGTILLLQQASYWKKSMSGVSYMLLILASDLYSCAISIKMNALLYLPGYLLVTYFLCDENFLKLLLPLVTIFMIQVLVGWNFLLPFHNDDEAQYIRWSYIKNAFDFSRKFMYKWTVNWKFLSEQTFLSDNFAHLLLILHLTVLLFFTFTRFLTKKTLGKTVTQLLSDSFKLHKSTISSSNVILHESFGPKYVMMVMSVTNVIGILFSRSLHYQFLSWYCWQLPYLLYLTGWNYIVGFAVFGIHEYCWNVFPATPSSSSILVTVLSLVLIGVWFNKENWEPDRESQADLDKEKKTQ